MKLITYPVLLTIIGLAGCAGVDPSAANRERTREMATTTTRQICMALDEQAPAAIRPQCPA